MTPQFWDGKKHEELKDSIRRCTLEEIENSLPKARPLVQRALSLSAQIKTLIANLRHTPYLPTHDQFDVAPEGADPEIWDQLSSVKVMLEQVHRILIDLLEIGCMIQDLEEGCTGWLSNDPIADIEYVWWVTEPVVGAWRHLDDDPSVARSLHELIDAPCTES